MVFVSSSCLKHGNIGQIVKNLAEAGFNNIELSGGTKRYKDLEKDLLELQEQYNLTYQLHNYFPPPEKDFVLNLASLNTELYDRSIHFCKNAIEWSRRLGGCRYGVHAGFLIDFSPDEAGKKIRLRKVADRQLAIERLRSACNLLTEFADKYDVSLYIENNVLSHTNTATFGKSNPFLLTDYDGYLELKEKFDFRLLFDVAHFKVSAKSIGLDYDRQLAKFLSITDYLHLSDNDGLHDQNRAISEDSSLFKGLGKSSLTGKTVTLEVYEDMDKILSSQKAVLVLMDQQNS